MLVIRYRRAGKKNKPTYRVVVAEHTFPINGRFTADLGSYNPHSKAVTLKKEEVMEWLKKGAKPSNSVAKLFEREKIKHNLVVVVKKKRSPKKAAAEAVKEAPVAEVAAETPAEETTETPATEVAETPAEEAPAPEAESEEVPAEEPKPEA